MKHRILVINPGSTSTKIAVFEGKEKLFDTTLRYSTEELASFGWVMEQVDFRRATIEKALADNNIDPDSLDAICARGGQVPYCAAGTYRVDQAMVDFMYTRRQGAHASNLGCVLALPVLMLGADVINRPVEKYIVRRYYREAQQILASMPRLKVIGVTGSFGKTSTKNYLYRILSEKYNVLMTPGNYNTTLGVVRTVREQLKPYHDIFIVEMGAKQPGDIREICDLVHPTIGIVTAVGEMHLETFHTVENILHTKFELLDALPEEGLGVVNLDSQPIAASDAPHDKRIVTYAVHNTAADYRAVDINYTSKLTDFSVATREGVRTGYATQLAGRGNILNLLAAIVVADRLGVEEALQKRAMRRIEQIEHRLSINRASGGVTVIDDAYNSNPAGARMALEVLRDFAVDVGGRRIVVTPGFVELGERQAELNRQFGRDMAKACDIAVVVNLTNREAITQGLTEAGFPAECIHQTASFTEASAFLLRTLTQGDVILYENDLPDSFR